MTKLPQACGAPLRRRTLLGFGVGSLGTGIFSTTPGVLLLYFMTDTLGVPAALAGLGVFLPKLWDVVTDPLMGFISDRTRGRYGRRRPYLLGGALAMFVTYVFLFTVPQFDSPIASFWYVTVLFTLSATAYTVFAIPYVAMPAEMSDDPGERVRILTYRMSFAMAGAIVGSAAAPWLVQQFGGGRGGYAAMSLVVGGVCAAAMLCAFWASRQVPLVDSVVSEGRLGQQLRDTLGSPRYRTIAVVYLVQILAVGTLMAAAPYFATYMMGADESLVGGMFLVMMGFATASIPLWGSAARRWGMRGCYLAAIAMLALASLGLWWLAPGGSLAPLYGLMAVIGIGFGAQQVLPFALLTDVIRADAERHGAGREGVATGVWVAGEKLGIALGPLTAGVILQLHGFREGTGVVDAQPESALVGIRLAFSVVPAALLAVSAALLLRFRATRPHATAVKSRAPA